MWKSRKYTKEDFILAVKNSISKREVLKTLGLAEAGGNYAILEKKLKSLNLDTSHWLGQGHLKGKKHTWTKKIPIQEILVNESLYNDSNKLRIRLIKENILEAKCYECGLTEWRGKSLSFDLEHKNGNRFDNRIDNLTILCPNCHSQTATYRGRNKKKC